MDAPGVALPQSQGMTTPGAAFRAFLCGVLTANSVPHAYAAAVGSTQLTPLQGRDSGPGINAVWASVNLAGAFLLASHLQPGSIRQRRWFRGGVAAFSATRTVAVRQSAGHPFCMDWGHPPREVLAAFVRDRLADLVGWDAGGRAVARW